jgi:hypothetical protein
MNRIKSGLFGLTVMMVLSLTGCGSGATTTTIADTTRPVVEALHKGDIAAAMAGFLDTAQIPVDASQLESGLTALAASDQIKTYKSLDVCEFGVMVGNGVQRYVGVGLLTHGAGRIRFQATVQKDSTGAWRLVGLFLNPAESTEPWGACR